VTSLQLAIVSQRVVTPSGVRPAAVIIEGSTIRNVVDRGSVPALLPVYDAGSLVVMPGLVDSHVHINEPGRTHWEGFETATKAAAAGGITTLVDMPLNCTPVTTSVSSFNEKLLAAQGKVWVDCGFYGGLVPGNAHQMESLIHAGVLGIKTFLIHSGIDDFPNVSEADLRDAMPIIAEAGVPLLVHAELGSSNAAHRSIPQSYRDYLSSHPSGWEVDAIRLMLRLCDEYKCRTHIVHLSTAEAVPELKIAKARGLPVTVETCPHYLCSSAEEIADGDTRFKCAPPIREAVNREALWNALRDGAIDSIVSDHSPCPPEMKMLKEGDFQKAWGGIASLQLGLAAVWTEAEQRGFGLTDIARWMSSGPAHLVGLGTRKGSIAPGYDADLVIWDPDEQFTVQTSILHHRHKLTPYDGRQLSGVVKRTIVRGVAVYDNGTFAGSNGTTLLRHQFQYTYQ
jgi:allantoinase